MNGAGKDNYLVDWEKPLYGDPVQDLGHFLAPTTTFWKTDVILTEEEMADFTRKYIQAVNGRFDVSGIEERLNIFYSDHVSQGNYMVCNGVGRISGAGKTDPQRRNI